MSRTFIPALGLHGLTPFYDSVVAFTTRELAFKQALIRLAAVKAAERVLDVGCGTGTLAVAIKQAAPEAIVTGLDADEAMLARARRKARLGGAAVDFVRGDSRALPWADNSFDKVVSSLFFHHLEREDKGLTLREILRVLRPGGELLVADWGRADGFRRVMFYVVQLVDGFAGTQDNVAGRLPEFFARADYRDISVAAEIAAPLGSIALYRAVRSATTPGQT